MGGGGGGGDSQLQQEEEESLAEKQRLVKLTNEKIARQQIQAGRVSQTSGGLVNNNTTSKTPVSPAASLLSGLGKSNRLPPVNGQRGSGL